MNLKELVLDIVILHERIMGLDPSENGRAYDKAVAEMSDLIKALSSLVLIGSDEVVR